MLNEPLNEEDFWQYSIVLYSDSSVQRQLLRLQDEFFWNINIALLCCYITQALPTYHRGLLQPHDINCLLQRITPSEQVLKRHREERRANKGSVLYKECLVQELALEKQQQGILIQTANSLIANTAKVVDSEAIFLGRLGSGQCSVFVHNLRVYAEVMTQNLVYTMAQSKEMHVQLTLLQHKLKGPIGSMKVNSY